MRFVLALTFFAFAVLPACSSHKTSAVDAPTTGPTAIVVAGDFTAGDPGVLATVNVDAKTVKTGVAPGGAVGDDPLLRLFGSDLYVINSGDTDNITILDAQNLSLVQQLATGSSSNPQDVALNSNNLYVPVFGGSGVEVLTRGSTSISVIDLSAGATTPGQPDCVANSIVGSQLFIACEELDNGSNFAVTGPGKVFVVDTTTNTVTSSFAMMNDNPVGWFHQLPNGDLAIETLDDATGSGPGCIEEITTTGTPASAGCLVTNTTLGGSVTRFEVQANAGSDTLLWLAVGNATFTQQSLYSYDLTTSKLSVALSPSDELIGDLAVCSDGTIPVTDWSKNTGGVRLYKNGKEETTAPFTVGLDTDSDYALVCDD